MNGYVDTAVDRFRFLSSMDRKGSETLMLEWEVVLLLKFLVANFRLRLFVEHPNILILQLRQTGKCDGYK